jgi:myosin heavy subunit
MSAPVSTTFAVDSRVFVKHPKKSWIPGFVSARDAKTGQYTVVDDDHDEVHKVTDNDITLCREDLLNEGMDPVVHDLLFLTVLHDATLLRCLRVRYMKDIIYTNIGAIVVALNPFNFKIPWYLDSEMDKYLAEGDVIRQNLPHSWAVAHNTYYEMISEQRPQTILVSGESGAGKTEACKMVMKYLGKVSMLRASEKQKDQAEQCRVRILQASPILEGFGNAKTVRNNNSSRFGKFIKVKFHDDGHLIGAFTINYLLEKSRIITCSPNERIYHAFYYASKGTDAEKLGIKGPKEYRSTNAGSCVAIEGVDDSADYVEVLEAMDVLDINKDEQGKLWRVVAGCLVAQNIDLSPIDKDTTQVPEHARGFLTQACALWGVDPTKYEKELLTTTSTVRGETFVMNHKLAVAVDMRDSVTKHLYERLFMWLVQKINDVTDDGGDVKNWIGVLDIFGFEDFEINSFEQVCINLANETLQNHYNNYIFKKDMEECRAEGICVDDVKCPDNSECLKLIVDGTGILGLLDEECRLGTGTDEGFLDKVTQHCTKNQFFERKPMMKASFTIKHYAGNVTYQIKGFLEKNRDTLKDDFKLLFRSSANDFCANLLPAPVERVGKTMTVGGFFKAQVAELMFLINSTNPHWIRCIKPHPAKKPLMFDGVSVTNQLESSGVLGTVKIRKAGFPVRLYYKNFLSRYKLLIGKCSPEEPLEVQKEAVRKAMKASKTTSREVQLGKTRVFMKSEAYFVLEQAREAAGINQRLALQAAARSVTSQLVRRRKVWDESVLILQDEFRDYLRRSAEVRKARRKAREELLANQKVAREAMMRECEANFKEIMEDLKIEYKAFVDFELAHRKWVEDKQEADLEEILMFQQLENRERHDQMNEYKGFLTAQRPLKAALHLIALPDVEASKRDQTLKSEDSEFRFLGRLFREHGAALFRMEIERAERRVRRIQMRLEDIQFAETVERAQLFPEYCVSLHRAAHPFGPAIQSIKAYAETVARRTSKREAVRAANAEVDFFSSRHRTDNTKLNRELANIQVGARATANRSYRRAGDKQQTTAEYASHEPWRGVTNVPDIDQVLVGMKDTPKKGKTANRHSDPSTGSPRAPSVGGGSPPRGRSRSMSATSPSPNRQASRVSELKTANVFETFKDKNDEMQFLRMRHVIAQDFKALAKQGQYNGPYVYETEIPNRAAFFSAQDKLQSIVQEYAAELVKLLRRLNTFCTTRGIPEQNHVTGEWTKYVPVARELLATYPPCNEWRLLLSETERLQYATDNYKRELLKILQQCHARGARLPAELMVNESSPVDKVHEAYFTLRGHFQACKRCLVPMASKATLVQMRLLWPHVQDSTLKDRCRECNTSIFSRGLDAVAIMPSRSTFIASNMN